MRLNGRDAVSRLTERRRELPLPAFDGAQPGIHDPPSAVCHLLHHVGQHPGLAHRSVDLLARLIGELELERQRGVQARVAAELRSNGLLAATHGRLRRGQVLPRLLNGRVRIPGERRLRSLELVFGGLDWNPQEAEARLGIAQRALPAHDRGDQAVDSAADLPQPCGQELGLPAERLRSACEIAGAVLRGRQSELQLVHVSGTAARRCQQALSGGKQTLCFAEAAADVARLPACLAPRALELARSRCELELGGGQIAT